MPSVMFVGLGSNLTSRWGRSPADTCRWAIRQVISISGLQFTDMSSLYRSAPVPASDQPDFVNAVIKVRGAVEPARLLEQLHLIEAQAGRVRGAVNAARVLDLDLLAVDDLVLPGPGLVLPHPRLHERAFVLYPLCDIDPSWQHPLWGQTAAELRDRLPPQRLDRLPDTTEDLLLRSLALR